MRDIKYRLKQLLVSWGDYEAQQLDGHQYLRSSIDRLDKPPTKRTGGHIPPIWTPADVVLARRLIALMTGQCRAGRRYAEILRQKYVRFEDVPAHVLTRAEDAVAKTWAEILGAQGYNYRKS